METQGINACTEVNHLIQSESVLPGHSPNISAVNILHLRISVAYFITQKQKIPKAAKRALRILPFFINPKEVYQFLYSGGTITICQSGRSSGSWIILLTTPSRVIPVVLFAAFVPRYSGGTTPDSHRVPSWLNLFKKSSTPDSFTLIRYYNIRVKYILCVELTFKIVIPII